MKRMNKKLLISAAIFSAAVNMNACAYGPPQDQMVNLSYIQKAEESVIPETEQYTEKSVMRETEQHTEKLKIPETDIQISNTRNGK